MPDSEEVEEINLHVLLVEDSADDAALIRQELRRAGLVLAMRQVDSAEDMTAALTEQDWDLVITDYNLPGFSGAHALQLVQTHAPEVPLIVVSGCIGEEAAVALMKAGAEDCIMKASLSRLVPAVERCIKEEQNRVQRQIAQHALRESEARLKALVSNIPGMVFQLLLKNGDQRSFAYVGEGCQALFGVSSRLLQRYPEYFFELILPDDMEAFMRAMRTSAEELAAWDLEFRIRVAGSADIKWVSLRASPRWPDDGSVLWEGIISDLTQSKLAEIEIRRSHEQVRELSAHLQTVKEQERTRIAREIHDALGGTLTAIKIELMRLGSGLAPGYEQARERLRSAEELVDSALETTRRISTDLRPGILDLGIVAAMEWQGAEFTKRMGIPCMVACTQEHINLADEVSIALFRIFQETLTNVAKHAEATRVEVTLDATEDSITLVVHDNGRGFSESDLTKPRAFGIRGIQERAYNLGGEASVRRLDKGAEITVRVPRGTYEEADDFDDAQLDLRLLGAGSTPPRTKRRSNAARRTRKVEQI